MKVAQIVAYPPFHEGTGTVAYYFGKELRNLGVEVEVFIPGRGEPQKDYDQSFYRYLPTWFSIQNAFLNPQILKIKGFDIIHLHLPYIFGSELLYLKSLVDKFPLVVTYHNDLIGKGVKSAAFYLYQKLFPPLILRKADRITINSFDHARSSVFNEKVFDKKADQIIAIPSGVDVDTFKPGLPGGQIRAKFDFNPEDVIVLFVSSLDKAHVSKGLFFLLKAISLLKEVKSIKLLVIGGGEMKEEYAATAVDLGIGDIVRFSGRIPHHQLPLYYNAGDMVVIPSVAESFGLSIAEGMACGLPAIATNNPGVRVVIQNEESGFLVPYDHVPILAGKIRELVENPQLRKTMGEKGRERILKNFTWEIAAKKLLDVYREIQMRK